MGNVFDQFDAAPSAAASSAPDKNVFDQFDATSPASTEKAGPPDQPLNTARNDFWNNLPHNTGLLARAGAEGLSGLVALPGNLAAMGINAATGSNIKSPSQGFDEFLSNMGVPQPQNATERLGSDVTAGLAGGAMMGPGAALSGASSGLAAGSAREAGASPLVQFGAGLAGGFIPGAANSAINYLTRVKPPTFPIEAVDPDSRFIAAVKPVQKNYENTLNQENKLWQDARDSGKTTILKSDVVSPLPSKIETALNENAQSLDDENLKPLTQAVNKFKQYQQPAPKFKYTGQDEGVYVPQADPGAPLSEIQALRSQISTLAGKHTDGNVRKAAGIALKQIDDHMADHVTGAILSGDDEALAKFKTATNYSRQKFQNYGTNAKAGQNPMFERIITKADENGQGLDNTQIVKAFGATARGNAATSPTIQRLIQMAGPEGETVRSNIAQGYLERAIEKSTDTLQGGESIVKPGRLRVELSRLIAGSTSDGGPGEDLRNIIFKPEELSAITDLRDNLKDAKSWTGAVRALGVKIPLASSILTKPEIRAGRNARNLVQSFLTQQAQGAQSVLKGQPFNYSKFLSNAAQSAGRAGLPTAAPAQPPSKSAAAPAMPLKDALSQAKAAIAAGADPHAVMDRMEKIYGQVPGGP